MARNSAIRNAFARQLGAALLASAIVTIMVPGATADTPLSANSSSETVWKVDMRGKPPYKRERVEVPVVDIASMEVDAGLDGETMVLWERDVAGRPPFRRQRVEVPVVDTAAMEVLDAPAQRTDFRGRPPFKRHR